MPMCGQAPRSPHKGTLVPPSTAGTPHPPCTMPASESPQQPRTQPGPPSHFQPLGGPRPTAREAVRPGDSAAATAPSLSFCRAFGFINSDIPGISRADTQNLPKLHGLNNKLRQSQWMITNFINPLGDLIEILINSPEIR